MIFKAFPQVVCLVSFQGNFGQGQQPPPLALGAQEFGPLLLVLFYECLARGAQVRCGGLPWVRGPALGSGSKVHA